jgi:RNA-directed DNA polymerase
MRRSTRMEQQQGADYQQLSLFEAAALEAARHDLAWNGATEPARPEERQARAARRTKRAVATDLMAQICTPANLNRAYQRVRANQGAPGGDGMTVHDLRGWLATHKVALVAALHDGTYQPQPVKGVTIPKASGGTRQLGIPTVVDRLVQQAILQVLSPLLDPTFSASSFGFRPGRSAHDALAHARQAVADGHTVVVDLDLEAFFDRVNHDMVMARLARHVGDRCLLGIVRRFLEAGLLLGGVVVTRVEGTPQGGPLSPLLANLMLHDLDEELERRGHRFARYADDCNIYVRTQAAGERVLASVTRYLEARLKLRVNRAKSAVAPVGDRKFLGYRLLRGGRLTISPAALQRVKTRIRAITRRNRGVALGQVIQELNGYLTGWVTYFRHAEAKTVLAQLDQWINEKVRCYRLKQCKRSYGIARFLQAQGVPARRAWAMATSGKGWWRKTKTPQAKEAMPVAWLRTIGLVSLEQRCLALNQ